jgi:dual specificity phosphatase 12
MYQDANDINEIIPRLFISNWETSNNFNIIKHYNIKAVITLTSFNKPENVTNFYKNNNIDFLFIKIDDSPSENIYQYFDMTYNFIDKYIEKNENVLVHCMAGISRSSTIILNYMLKKIYIHKTYKNLCPCKMVDTCLQIARNNRNFINPNQGFKFQLIIKCVEYEKINLKV